MDRRGAFSTGNNLQQRRLPRWHKLLFRKNTCQGAVAIDQVLDPECKKPVPFGERCAVAVEGEWNDGLVGRRDHRMRSVCWRQSITVDQRLKVFQHLRRAVSSSCSASCGRATGMACMLRDTSNLSYPLTCSSPGICPHGVVCSSLRVRPERIRVHWTNGTRLRCPPAYLLCGQDTLNVEI